jgi:hypothetical protein
VIFEENRLGQWFLKKIGWASDFCFRPDVQFELAIKTIYTNLVILALKWPWNTHHGSVWHTLIIWRRVVKNNQWKPAETFLYWYRLSTCCNLHMIMDIPISHVTVNWYYCFISTITALVGTVYVYAKPVVPRVGYATPCGAVDGAAEGRWRFAFPNAMLSLRL